MALEEYEWGLVPEDSEGNVKDVVGRIGWWELRSDGTFKNLKTGSILNPEDIGSGGGGGADETATFVTKDAESNLDNSTQHANLSGGDLHDPSTHGDEAHSTNKSDEGHDHTETNETAIGPAGLDAEPFVYDPGMLQLKTDFSNTEINRIGLQAGEKLVIERIELRQKGGGSSTSVNLEVRDTTAASTIGSQNLGGTTKDPGESGAGNTVIVRATNDAGSNIDSNPRVTGYITST